MLYQLSYASLRGPVRPGRPRQTQFYTPAGTIIEPNTTATHVQANGWISNNFPYAGDFDSPLPPHSRKPG
jgi:hypothetical protein